VKIAAIATTPAANTILATTEDIPEVPNLRDAMTAHEIIQLIYAYTPEFNNFTDCLNTFS